MATKILIASTVLGSDTASITFSDIPQTFDDLLLVGSIRSARSGQRRDSLNVSFNSSTSSFSGRHLRGSGSAASSATTTRFIGEVPAATATASAFASLELIVPNYTGSANKSFSVTCAQEDNQAEAYIDAVAGLWSVTDAVTAVAITSTNSANLVTASSAYLYGIKRS